MVILLVYNKPVEWLINDSEYRKIIYVNCWLQHKYQSDLCSNPTNMHIYKTRYWNKLLLMRRYCYLSTNSYKWQWIYESHICELLIATWISVIFAVTLQICIYIKHVIENKLLLMRKYCYQSTNSYFKCPSSWCSPFETNKLHKVCPNFFPFETGKKMGNSPVFLNPNDKVIQTLTQKEVTQILYA